MGRYSTSRSKDAREERHLNGDTRTPYDLHDREELVRQLVDYVRQHGREPDTLTQDVVLAKPSDEFWIHLNRKLPNHSDKSWKSHYLKNKAHYMQMAKYQLADSDDSLSVDRLGDTGDESQSQPDVADHVLDTNQDEESEGRHRASSISRSQRRTSQHEKPDRSRGKLVGFASGLDEESNPSDGIVVLIPNTADADEYKRASRKKKKKASQSLIPADRQQPAPAEAAMNQWTQAPTPPLMEEDDEDMMQVEAEMEAIENSRAQKALEGGQVASIDVLRTDLENEEEADDEDEDDGNDDEEDRDVEELEDSKDVVDDEDEEEVEDLGYDEDHEMEASVEHQVQRQEVMQQPTRASRRSANLARQCDLRRGSLLTLAHLCLLDTGTQPSTTLPSTVTRKTTFAKRALVPLFRICHLNDRRHLFVAHCATKQTGPLRNTFT